MPTVVEIKAMYLENKFDHLDPTHFRCAILQVEIAEKGVQFFCELEVHFVEILQIGANLLLTRTLIPHSRITFSLG